MRCVSFEIFVLAIRFGSPFQLERHAIRFLRILRSPPGNPATSRRELPPDPS
jgi:hypothetical protein